MAGEALSEDDIKFYLSIEPDEESVRKAVERINRDINSEKVAKIRMGIESDIGRGPQKPSMMGKVGGAIGTAAGAVGGGAVDLAGGALNAAMGAVKTLATAPFKAINAGLGLVSDVLHDIQGPLGPIGAGLNLFSKGLDTVADTVRGLPVVGETLGSILGSLAKLPTILKSILEAGVSLAAKASPGTVRQMSMAVEDFQATVGQMFVPVVELMGEVVRDLSDVIANFLPNTEEMRGAIDEVRKAWGLANVSLKEAALEIGPAIRETIVGAIKSLGETLAKWMPSLDQTKGALDWIKGMWVKVKDVVVDVAKQVWDFATNLVNSFKSMMSGINELVEDLKFKLSTPLVALTGGGGADYYNQMKEEQKFAQNALAEARASKKDQWGGSASGGDWGDEALATARKTPDGQLPRSGIVAARSASMGGIQEYQNRLQMSSMMGSYTRGPESVPGNVDKIAGAVGGIAAWFAKMTPEQVQAMVKAGGGDPNGAQEAVRRAEEAASIRRGLALMGWDN